MKLIKHMNLFFMCLMIFMVQVVFETLR